MFLGQVTESPLLLACEAGRKVPATCCQWGWTDKDGCLCVCAVREGGRPGDIHVHTCVSLLAYVYMPSSRWYSDGEPRRGLSLASFCQWLLSWEGTSLLDASRTPWATEAHGEHTTEF